MPCMSIRFCFLMILLLYLLSCEGGLSWIKGFYLKELSYIEKNYLKHTFNVQLQ